MDAEWTRIAQNCMKASHDGSLGFPQIVEKLMTAGFEGYTVDYRCNSQTFYLPGSNWVRLEMLPSPGTVASTFNAPEIERLVRWAQACPADYSYVGFSEKAKAAGCAGYQVSFPGRRVVYFGRTAETHVEHFPN